MSRGEGDPNGGVADVRIRQVDVFTDTPMSGNGLAVVQSPSPLGSPFMQAVARELRQFETIFLTDVDETGASARIFTEQEELPFAGHPVLGAAAVLHWEQRARFQAARWRLRVRGRSLTVHTTRSSASEAIDADMDQGAAAATRTLTPAQTRHFAEAVGVMDEHIRHDLPCQVVTTGLPYLLLPVSGQGLAESQVRVPDLTERLRNVGAAFIYVLDPDVPEGRTWDNAGAVEDVATGSAAGPAGGYLIAHGLRPAAHPILMQQGRFAGRPSVIRVRRDRAGSMWVGGPVVPFSVGRITTPATGDPLPPGP